MAKVTGSKQEKMIVVPHRPMRDWAVRTCFAIAVLFVGVGFYLMGFSRGVDLNVDARIERDGLQSELALLEEELAEKSQELVNSEQSNIVDRNVLSEVQETIVTYRERITQLEADVLFYKNIMSPENEDRGLIIGQFDIFESNNSASAFLYHIELRQLGNNQTFIDGYTNVNIVGFEDGEEKSLPLRTVSLNEDQLDIKLRFQYYQNIEGELELPAGFSPDKVQIMAVAEGSNSKTVQQDFGWIVQNSQE